MGRSEGIPAIDALKGIAILMVMILHFYREAAINAAYPFIGPIITKLALSGIYGVELFFVLSGFVITRILLDSKNEPHYFGYFYMRRFMRIFPLYYATLCIVFFILPLVITFDSAAEDIASRQVWLWTLLSNAPWSGYGWDNSNVFRLGHLWFLCVVVHFYIVWPLIIHKFELKTVFHICIGLMAILFLARAVHALTGGPELFYWSSIRKLDGLVLGSLLAAGLRLESARQLINKHAFKAAVTAGCLFLALIFVPRRLITGYYWMVVETISVIFFGGIFVLLLRKDVLPGWMRNRVLFAFGKYSYGLFVIHNICLPFLLWLFNTSQISGTVASPLLRQALFYVFAISGSFLLAFASWHLYEKHFLKLKIFFNQGRGNKPEIIAAPAGKMSA